MNTINIQYVFKLPGKQFTFDYAFSEEDFSLLSPIESNDSHWTKLNFHKCNHCPLNEREFPVCPLAKVLSHVIEKLDIRESYEDVLVEVVMPNRKITSRPKTKMQDAVASLLGLLIPTCGCPHTAFFTPMARFHLPFSDGQETVYRALSMFILNQYFEKRQKEELLIDFDKLQEAYKNIGIVDEHICKRLRQVTSKDTSVNALIKLHTTSQTIELAKKREFVKLRKLFETSS